MILFTGIAQLNYYLSLMWRSRIICCDLFYYYYYYHYFICARINQWQSIQEWNNLINNADIRALLKNHRKSLFVLVWKRFFKHDNTEINCIFLKSIICKYFSVLPRRSPHILPGMQQSFKDQARIHTGFHRWTEIGQIFRNKYIVSKKTLNFASWNLENSLDSQ